MSDETEKRDVDKPGVESLQIVGSASAPFIYFDAAPTFGIQGGAIMIELVAKTVLPGVDVTSTEIVATAHLRCSPDAAKALLAALNGALGMLEAPVDPMLRN